MKWHLIRWIGVGIDEAGLLCVKLVVDEGTEISARGETLSRAFTCALDKLEPAVRQNELEPPTMLPWERLASDKMKSKCDELDRLAMEGPPEEHSALLREIEAEFDEASRQALHKHLDEKTIRFIDQATTDRKPGHCGKCGEPSDPEGKYPHGRVLCDKCMKILGQEMRGPTDA